MKKSIAIVSLGLLMAGSATMAVEQSDWVPLFDGKTLKGWENPYDWGTTKVVDGEIHLVAGRKFFLCTAKQYADFIFEAEVKMPEGNSNSGFMFRCHKQKNKVFGYQAEVDTSACAWSGGLYDEGRRGWLHPKKPNDSPSGKLFREKQGKAFKRNDWNRYRIHCEGQRIRIYVNDVLCTDLVDDADKKGHIALQHHGEKGQLYRFRNIRIKKINPPRAADKKGALVKLDITLPTPIFIGTPKDIRTANLEPSRKGKVRSPFYAPKGTKNVASKKPVTSSDMQPIIGELDLVTDGDKEGSDGSYVELGPLKQHVQIDLEAKCVIHAILVWHYHTQACVYRDVVIQVADDPDFITNVRTVFNNDHDNSSGFGIGKDKEWIETYEGRLIATKGVKARYVRLYSNGSTASEMNHYVEVEVYGQSAK